MNEPRNGREPRQGARALDRPLRLGEVFEVTIEIYRERVGAAFALGGLVGLAFIATAVLPDAIRLPLVAVVFTLGLGLASGIAAGDDFQEACLRVASNGIVLLTLAIVVALPFVLALSQLLFLIFAVAWLALVGFSIPVAAVERADGEPTFFRRLAYPLERSLQLARVEYLHAAGVIAALVIAYIVISVVLGAALVGFAENGGLAAIALIQVVMAPFFLLGLAVLYFDQKARALSSRRAT